ncbi:RDD family protein [Pelagicoccus mobilis]|uniref:RDD family protein n=1 Tax=Pelagicoccus mobilis TaxID=415221 RepID=A0A934VPB2_9BACT|nr:RDD family protein [Pelagicoccus mobilis]MBK1877102.1 RDD family protein [Pelagicoccus mobilis]
MNTAPADPVEQSTEAEPIDPSYQYSGFWRRVLAYSIDAILLGAIGLALGFTFYDYFLSIGQAGRLLGLVIYLGYFATLNSQIGNGQTLGKRMLSIQVLNQEGNTLNLQTALIRQSIIAAPIFLNGLTLPSGKYLLAATVLLGVIVFGVGGVIGYFLLFNTRTRRSLHDFICGSHVVKLEKDKTSIDVPPLWKGHLAILAAITLSVATGGVFLGDWAKNNFDLTQITALYNKLSEQEHIRQAGVHLTNHYSFGSDKQDPVTVLQLVASPPHSIPSPSKYALEVVAVALKDETILPDSDVIALSILTGFDLGIAKQHTTRSVSDSPANWKAAIEYYETEGQVPNTQFSSTTNIRF